MLRYMIFFYILTDEDGVGLGWGGVGIIPNVSGATLHDLHLHLMLRYMIFTCTWCYATWCSLALDATLHVLHLHLMLRCMIFTCAECYATWSSFTFWQMRTGWGWRGVGIIPNVSRATLHDLHLHLMLRYMILLALDATLRDLHLHLMLRYMIFTCT